MSKRYIKKLFLIALMILGGMIGTGEINYYKFSKIIMSPLFSVFFYKYYLGNSLLKILFLIVLVVLCNRSRFSITLNGCSTYKFNIVGDIIHRSRIGMAWKKDYTYIYRNGDFLLWKVFSAVIFMCCCYLIKSNVVLFFINYGICIISSFYFLDIYNLERNNLFIYFMSDYLYEEIFKDHVISGMLMLGDWSIVCLLIRSLWLPSSIWVLIGLVALTFFISNFICSNIYAKYPRKMYFLNMVIVLIKLNIPVFNIVCIVSNLKVGKKNWRRLNDEEKEWFSH